MYLVYYCGAVSLEATFDERILENWQFPKISLLFSVQAMAGHGRVIFEPQSHFEVHNVLL